MARFFIRYRREESSGHPGRIYDHLLRSFGVDNVFMDVAVIEPGQDFIEVIQNAVTSCSALIVVIGRNWLGLMPDGRRRIDDPDRNPGGGRQRFIAASFHAELQPSLKPIAPAHVHRLNILKMSGR